MWKESDIQFTEDSEVQQYNGCADMQSVGVVTTLHMNDRMIIEVHPCIFLFI